MEVCFRCVLKTFKNKEEAAKRQQEEVRIINLRGVRRILCRMKVKTLGKERAFYCLTVMVSKKIEFCVH